jgi:hypothetical protein
MAWIGRGCKRAMLRGRRRSRECRDIVNRLRRFAITAPRESDSLVRMSELAPELMPWNWAAERSANALAA